MTRTSPKPLGMNRAVAIAQHKVTRVRTHHASEIVAIRVYPPATPA